MAFGECVKSYQRDASGEANGLKRIISLAQTLAGDSSLEHALTELKPMIEALAKLSFDYHDDTFVSCMDTAWKKEFMLPEISGGGLESGGLTRI